MIHVISNQILRCTPSVDGSSLPKDLDSPPLVVVPVSSPRVQGAISIIFILGTLRIQEYTPMGTFQRESGVATSCTLDDVCRTQGWISLSKIKPLFVTFVDVSFCLKLSSAGHCPCLDTKGSNVLSRLYVLSMEIFLDTKCKPWVHSIPTQVYILRGCWPSALSLVQGIVLEDLDGGDISDCEMYQPGGFEALLPLRGGVGQCDSNGDGGCDLLWCGSSTIHGDGGHNPVVVAFLPSFYRLGGLNGIVIRRGWWRGSCLLHWSQGYKEARVSLFWFSPLSTGGPV